MIEKLLKFVVLVGLIVAIPVLWYYGITNFKMNMKGILLMTGGSLFALGLCYKLLGSWDLIPDWIPLLGGLDDSIAWIVMLVGAVVAGGGFALGG